jgi:RHS repeat-associated protein
MVQEHTGSGPYTAYSRTRYYYDLLGNLKEVRTTDGTINGDPNPTGPETLRRVVMGYDNFGRKTSMNDPDMGPWSYQYDAPGNLTSQVDAKGQRLCFTYDVLDRLTFKRHDSNNNGCDSSDVQLARYIYYGSGTGKVGQVSEIRWSGSSTQNRETFDYDTLGRLITHNRWVDSRQYTMSYGSFDALHRPRAITYPTGEVVALTYDREGENSLKAGSDWLVNNVTYNGRGQMRHLQRPTVSDTQYFYYNAAPDPAGSGNGNFRLKEIRHGNTTDSKPDFTYTYDKAGNVLSMVTATGSSTDTQSFGYDALNRLTSAAATGGVANYSHSYAYNRIGNITSFAGSSYAYNDPAHKQAVTHIGGVQRFWYDANGNMTKRIEGGVTYDPQTFDVQNRLVSVTRVGTGTTTFAYDAAGIRVKTVRPNGDIIYTPFPTYEEEVRGATTIKRSSYGLVGQTIALRVSGDPVSGNNGLFFYYTDHLSSTSIMLRSNGDFVSGSTARYHPFGGFRTTPTAGLTDVGFTGHRHNNIGAGAENIGLIYMNARWYSPIGRFISADTLVPDPANPQSYNRYSYVRNNPLGYRDPTGHYECHTNGICADIITSTWTPTRPASPNRQSLISFTGGVWTDAERETVLQGAYMLAQALARTMNDLSGGAYDTIGWEDAFFAVFGGKVTFHKTGTDCASGCWGERVGQNLINVYNNMGNLSSLVRGSARITNGELWAVHELGHDFEAQLSRARGNVWGPARTALRQSNVPSERGFAGPFGTWRRSDSPDFGEQFADSVVGWTYNRWAVGNDGQITGAGLARQDFMRQQMSLWVSEMTGVGLCGGGCR